MNNKKLLVIIIIFILAIIIFSSISEVQAMDILEESFNSSQNFINNGKSEIINYKNVYKIINFLYNFVMAIGIIGAIIVGMIIGIRIIFGSIDEKADSKHLLVPYLAILIIMSLTLTLWKFGLNLLYNNIK